MTRRGLVIGCGGTLGFAWTASVLAALEEALDWDVRTADVLVGTSAGSEMVGILGSGRSPHDILLALGDGAHADTVLVNHFAYHPGMTPPLPKLSLPGLGLTLAALRTRHVQSGLAGLLPRGRGDATWLANFGSMLSSSSGWVDHPAAWIMTADLGTGATVALGSPDAPKTDLGTAMCASWAIPGWFPPVTIDGRRYVDGGAVSSASADVVLGANLDEVVIVAPMTSMGGAPARGVARVERLLRSQMTRGLDREQRALEGAGVRVIRIEPGREDLAVMGANFMDVRRRTATLETAVRTAPASVAAALARADRRASA